MNLTIVRELVFKSLLIYNLNNCGHSSVVERLVANEKVEGSTPFARSKERDKIEFFNYYFSKTFK
tara:strand:- start:1061 stop:1255 length:195 start_codon:yes stop_codon:yes gene_type:complete